MANGENNNNKDEESQTDEGWTCELPSEGAAYPTDFSKIVFQWMEKEETGTVYNLLLNEEKLFNLISYAFQASLRSEEGRPIRFRLLFNPLSPQLTVKFTKAIPYTVKQLVKLSPTIGLGFRFIVVAPDVGNNGDLNIVGVCDPELSPLARNSNSNFFHKLLHLSTPNVEGIKIIVSDPGNIRLITPKGKTFDLNEGTIKFPIAINRIQIVRDWEKDAALNINLWKLKNKKTRNNLGAYEAVIKRAWKSVLNRVSIAKHGGCFLVIPCGKKLELNGVVKIKYEVDSNIFREAIKERCKFEPHLSNKNNKSVAKAILSEAPMLERNLSRASDLVASLASVDGAVILEDDLNILGAGSEILGTESQNSNEKIEFATLDLFGSLTSEERPLTSFGMRHRSAIRFCQEIKGAIAFVISQDGDIRIFTYIDNRIIAYEPTLDDVF